MGTRSNQAIIRDYEAGSNAFVARNTDNAVQHVHTICLRFCIFPCLPLLRNILLYAYQINYSSLSLLPSTAASPYS